MRRLSLLLDADLKSIILLSIGVLQDCSITLAYYFNCFIITGYARAAWHESETDNSLEKPGFSG
jgi:hypothetical protein